MSSQSGQISTIRNRQYWTDAYGVEWTRKINRDGSYTEWERVEPEPEPEPEVPPLYLYVIQELQAEGEPMHWSLFVAEEGARGTVYQVTGDATFMHYQHAANSDIMNSDSYHNSYQMCRLDDTGLQWLEYYANNVAPPSAPSRAHVSQNCQTWVIQVLRELQSANVVEGEDVDGMEALVEPIN